MNIKVAIRVRPFNAREQQMNSDLCVKMNSDTTEVIDEDGKTPMKSFTLDHCFWSHNGFVEEADGYLKPDGPTSKYADQKQVYKMLGKDLLSNALEGYNCCLFAYGQTGSGKSYSIFGYGNNKGIVPMLCNELLDGNHLSNSEDRSFTLAISMLEIYNEKVQDLLVPISQRPRGGLKVRENVKIGVFVENLLKYEVGNYEEIEQVIAEGNKNKTLASTLMNATSSRAHTIITLELIQKEVTLGKQTQKTSVINLVDLAGSEKVSKTGAKDDRLKEACSINKSLSVLGIVINQLYKKSEGHKTIVSYRDAVLTYILRNALGGNSRTTMVCSISPARDNIDETISTLRYADQAKRIKQHAVINESETDKLIKELKMENDNLKEMLAKLQAGGSVKNIDDIQEQIKEISHAIENRSIITQNKVSQQRKMTSNIYEHPHATEDLTKQPHMLNLNEDPLLDGKIHYSFKETPIVVIGRATGDDLNTMEMTGSKVQRKIVLNGVGIQEEHARISYNEHGLFLHISNEAAASNVFVNGDTMDNFEDENGNGYSRQLEDLDRIVIGTSSTFLIRLPLNGVVSDKVECDGRKIDWEFCQMEKMKNQERAENERLKQFYEEKEKELAEKEQELKSAFEKEKESYEMMIRDQQKSFKEKMQDMQISLEEKEKQSSMMKQSEEEMSRHENERAIVLELKEKEIEHEKRLANLQKERRQLHRIQQISETLEKKLINYYPKINEANAIAQTLNRNIEFFPFAASLNLFAVTGEANISAEVIINIKVVNYEDGWINYWDLEKFENRLQLMKEAVEYFFNHNALNYTIEDDPFWDPKEFALYAQGICIMKNILYRFQMEHKAGLLGYEGDIGHINLRLLPVDDEGKAIDEEEEEEEIEEPTDLIKLDRSCHFRIEIDRIVFYSIDALKDKMFYLTYDILTGKDTETFKTPTYTITDNNVDIYYSQLISIPKVNEDIISYYMHTNLQVKLLIDDIEHVPVRGKLPPPIIEKEKQLIHMNMYHTAKQDVDVKGKLGSLIDKHAKGNKKKSSKELGKRKQHSSTVCTIW